MRTIMRFLNLLGRRKGDMSASQSRVLKAGLSGMGQALFKGSQILVTIVSVPLMMAYLGNETFGLAMALIGFSQCFLLTDAGLGEGVKLRLVESMAREDREAVRSYVSTGFFAIFLLVPVVSLGFCTAYPLVAWETVFHVAPDSSSVGLRPALLASLIPLFFLLPLRILREIYTADQRGYVYFSILSVGTLASLGGIVAAIQFDLGLVGILLAMQGSVLLAHLACALYLFVWDMPWLAPRWSHVRRWAWKNMWSDSLMLFVLGVSLIAINGTDVFLVNHYLGGSDASVYSLSLRVFLYVEVVTSFLTYPAWPAIGNALQKGEHRWARNASRFLFVSTMLFAVAMCGLLMVFGKSLISVWSRGLVIADPALLLVLACYVMTRIWCAVFGILLRAFGRVRCQTAATLAEAVLHVGLGIVLLQHFGLLGMAVGSLFSILVTRAWALPLEYWHVARTHRKQNQFQTNARAVNVPRRDGENPDGCQRQHCPAGTHA